MKLVRFGDMSSLEEEYRTVLNLNEENFKSSVYDRDGKQGILWDLLT